MKTSLPAISAAVAAAVAAGCQTTPIEPDPETLALIEARQGEEVDRICFSRSVDSWRELDRDSVLVRRGVNDWYQLELSGSCRPNRAFDSIAIRSRPAGSCITRGDTLVTDERGPSGFCFISKIYEWDEDAEVAETADAGGEG